MFIKSTPSTVYSILKWHELRIAQVKLISFQSSMGCLLFMMLLLLQTNNKGHTVTITHCWVISSTVLVDGLDLELNGI